MFHVQGHHHTGTDFLTHLNTRSPVVKAVKLMACRQAKSSLKIPSWSGECYLLWNVWRRHFLTWSGGNLQRWFCLPTSHQFDCFHHRGSCIYVCQRVNACMVVSLTHGWHMEHLNIYRCLKQNLIRILEKNENILFMYLIKVMALIKIKYWLEKRQYTYSGEIMLTWTKYIFLLFYTNTDTKIKWDPL